jgi:hypothetical protein
MSTAPPRPSSTPPRSPIAVRIAGDRTAAARCVEQVGGEANAFDYTVDYATGAALIVARDVEGLRTLQRLLEIGLAVPVRDLPRRLTARSMPRVLVCKENR